MEKKICVKCGIEIKKEDEWYENTLFKQGKKDSVVYFHRQCYKDFHKDKFQEEFQKKANKMMPILQKVIGGLKA